MVEVKFHLLVVIGMIDDAEIVLCCYRGIAVYFLYLLMSLVGD